MTIQWSKEDCRLCDTDGKKWQWTQRGGQSYSPCDHKYDRDTLTIEVKEIIKKITRLEARKEEIKEMLKLPCKEI